MPYGVKPATGIFQRFIENALANIPYTAIKVDDILISGKTDADHIENIENVLRVLKEVGTTVNKKKCMFFVKEIECVVFIVNKNGICLNPHKIDAINELPEPKDLKQLQSFLGGINYYSKFIPNMAEIGKPLYYLLEKDAEWKWTKTEQLSFENLKQVLLTAPVLTIFDQNLPLKLDCDASQYGLEAVLSHVCPDKSERPIAYASRTLNEHELNYSQIDKEEASIIFTLKKFSQYLLGNHFILTTDNKAIKKIFDSKTEISPIAAGRLVRWSLILAQYDYELKFRSTKEHSNADMLSRLPTSVKSKLPVDNMILVNVLSHLQNGKWPDKISDNIKPYYNKQKELTIEDGVILWGLRVTVPEQLRKKVLKELYQNHPGISRMKSLSRIHIWFPNTDHEIENIVKSCQSCEKVSNESNKSQPHQWDWTTHPMDRVHIDYFEYNKNNFLIMVDSHSKLLNVETVSHCDTENATLRLSKWFSQYGIPVKLISDNGTQFT